MVDWVNMSSSDCVARDSRQIATTSGGFDRDCDDDDDDDDDDDSNRRPSSPVIAQTTSSRRSVNTSTAMLDSTTAAATSSTLDSPFFRASSPRSPHVVNTITTLVSSRLRAVPNDVTDKYNGIFYDDYITKPIPPTPQSYMFKYRKCYGPWTYEEGYCCANRCSRPAMLSYPCEFCYAEEYSWPVAHDTPCRCDCLVFQHDVCWTHVTLGRYKYEDEAERLRSFYNWKLEEYLAPTSLVLELVKQGFAFVDKWEKPPRDEAGNPQFFVKGELHVKIRCYACLFATTIPMTRDGVAVVNAAHAGYSPYCAYAKMDELSRIERNRAHIQYHNRFAKLTAVDYAMRGACACMCSEPYSKETGLTTCHVVRYRTVGKRAE